jgi:hypothetical protein
MSLLERVPTLAHGHLRARHMRADISVPTVARKYNFNILSFHLRNYWSEYQFGHISTNYNLIKN